MNLVAKYKKSSSKKSVIFLLISVILIVIFANLLPKIQVYMKRSEAAALISFPNDHKSHPNYNAEWWYLNLLVRTERTDRKIDSYIKNLGYVLSFSRIANRNGLLNSRFDKSAKSFSEETDTGGTLTVSLIDSKYLFVYYNNGSNYATLEEKPPGTDGKKWYNLTGKTDQIGSFSLVLKERTLSNSPLLWGGSTGNCQGKISVFSENDTFYYSIPDLDITGTITDIDGLRRNVKNGKAWIDHQWFNSSPPADWKGHYWTSFHFTHINDLYNSTTPDQAVGFVTQIYTSGSKYTYWVKRDSDGTNQCGEDANITINSYGSTNYPSSWKVELKKSGVSFLEATGNSFSDNQILRTPIGPLMEASSYYSGKRNGDNFTGLGFFETHLTKPQ